MILMRSILAAMGSSGGIAWSSFGILSTAFSIAVASTAAIVLGAITGGIFVLFSLTILLVSYQHFKEEENKLNNKLIFNADKLAAELSFLIELMHTRYCSQLSPTTRFSDTIKLTLLLPPFSNTPKETREFLLALFSSPDFDVQQFIDLKSDSLQQRNYLAAALAGLARERVKKNMPPISDYEHFKAALFGFISVFGSVAGCTSGCVAMLIGVGLISGFSAIPLMGIAILVVAGALSVYCAVESVSLMKENVENKQTYKYCRTLADSLHQLNKSAVAYQPLSEVKRPVSYWPHPEPRLSRSLGSLPHFGKFFPPVEALTQDTRTPSGDTCQDDETLSLLSEACVS